ncbi:GIY-YIG nuclease family protein [Terasakiella sp. A23]|uniref:GIY-YIG nuclease family protein n=1 Tax=Terasakiella sp. FCG-A23 TaxID=3080561 RepID=UPI0029534705|nr:GIY-YIG nuclease family protein [Terasakiella sp. A23]MDV7341196.1 GIY-YIG nuclease family protein [Terasakiella sp. A23]
MGYVYILTSRRNGTLYIGVTSDIERRLGEHKSGLVAGFTNEYDVKMLVHQEEYPSMDQAIAREKP